MSNADARETIARCISSGMVWARAMRCKDTLLQFEGDERIEATEEARKLDWLHRFPPFIGKGKFAEVSDDAQIKTYFFRQFLHSDGEWARVPGTGPGSRREVYSDWSSGIFEAASFTTISSLDEDDRPAKFSFYEHTKYLGVEIERRMFFGVVAPLDSPARVPDAAVDARNTIYDWEAAFADVAAAFYWVEEFEDANARGVHARVVELLIQSFERRGGRAPGQSILKEKAKKIVGALRSGQGRSAKSA